MKYASIIFLAVFFSIQLRGNPCSSLMEISLLKKEPPFSIKLKRRVFLKKDHLVYCEKTLNKKLVKVADTPFHIIKDIKIHNNKKIVLNLSTKDHDENNLSFFPFFDGSSPTEIKTFFLMLQKKLRYRRSWQNLQAKLSDEIYSTTFVELIKNLKKEEEQNRVILTPTKKRTHRSKSCSFPQ